MLIVATYRHQQLAATNALITFLETYCPVVNENLLHCRDALMKGDIRRALDFAHHVRTFTNGGLSGTIVEPRFAHESQDYCHELLDALIKNWVNWMSAAEQREEPIDSGFILAVRTIFSDLMLREMLWLAIIVILGCGWWADHQRLDRFRVLWEQGAGQEVEKSADTRPL